MNPGKVSEVTYKRAILKNLNSGISWANVTLPQTNSTNRNNIFFIHPGFI